MKFEELRERLVEHETYLKNLETPNSQLVATANNAQTNQGRGRFGNRGGYSPSRYHGGRGRHGQSHYQGGNGRGQNYGNRYGSNNYGYRNDDRHLVVCQNCGNHGTYGSVL